jgi:hypothetical protein
VTLLRRRSAAAVAALAVSFVCAVLVATTVVVGVGDSDWMNPAHLLVIDRILAHPFVVLTVSIVAFLAAVVLWSRVAVLRIVALCTAACVFWAMVLLGIGYSLGHHATPTRYASPDGHYDVVVMPSSNFEGPLWILSVETHDGLLSREQYLGCMSGDNQDYAFKGLEWTGPDTASVTEGDGKTFEIHLNRGTGSPDSVIGKSLDCNIL